MQMLESKNGEKIMWYHNGEIIKTARAVTAYDKRYSKEVFSDSSTLSYSRY